jgi:hypothetical protein
MAEPWRVVRIYSNGCEVCPRIMAGQKVIAEVHGAPHLGFTDTLPNAYRMAASLELLVALESLLRWAETSQAAKTEGKAEHDDVVKGRARAAIAKATKETPA